MSLLLRRLARLSTVLAPSPFGAAPAAAATAAAAVRVHGRSLHSARLACFSEPPPSAAASPSPSLPLSSAPLAGERARSPTDSVPRLLMRVLGYDDTKAEVLRFAPRMFGGLKKQALSPEFYDVLGVSRAFEQRFQVMVLHYWMLLTRLRTEGQKGKMYVQAVSELLFDDAWRMIVADGVPGFQLNKRMATLGNAYYGALVALDEGHLTSDMRLAGALFRNIYQLSGNACSLAATVEYVRAETDRLAKAPLIDVLRGEQWGPVPGTIVPMSMSRQ